MNEPVESVMARIRPRMHAQAECRATGRRGTARFPLTRGGGGVIEFGDLRDLPVFEGVSTTRR